MKSFVVTIPARIETTTPMIRAALGAEMMKHARAAVKEEAREDLAQEIRRSSVSAYEAAVTRLVNAYGRYEDGKGTRDEMRALANLEAACVGLRSAQRNLKKMTAALAANEKEN